MARRSLKLFEVALRKQIAAAEAEVKALALEVTQAEQRRYAAEQKVEGLMAALSLCEPAEAKPKSKRRSDVVQQSDVSR